MDSRCIRRLKNLPQEFCPAAIARLRWREEFDSSSGNKRKEPTEQEEANAPGCPWAVKSHQDMFCFFKAVSDSSECYTDAQIAHMLDLKEMTIKRIRKRAMAKIADRKELKEIRDLYAGEPIVQDRLYDPYEDQLNDMSGLSVSSDDSPSDPNELTD